VGSSTRLTPFMKFLRGLQAANVDLKETFDELIAFAEIMAMKQNSLEMDEDGIFYVTATGPVEDIVPILHKQLERLERIQKQKGTI
jgi:DNA polymerase II small subunit/DNA polymerase delta subunit B